LKTLEKTGRVSTGKNPDAILYDPVSKKVFAFNNDAETATVIDASSGKVVAQVQLGGNPEFAVTDGNGKIYVNLEDKSQIAVIDSKTLKTTAHWSLAPGENPTGLALDLQHHRLFSGCRNKLMAIVDSETGKLINTLPIGAGVDATAFDPATQNAFSSNGRDGTITVIYEADPNTFSVTQNLSTQVSARTMTYDAAKKEIWVVGATPQEEPESTAPDPNKHKRRSFLPESFSAYIIGKHIPVDEGVPFNKKHAAFDKNIRLYFISRAAQNLPPIKAEQ
jgi:YVTN family beta-propeller protein